MTDDTGPDLESPSVVPLNPNRPSAAPLGPQRDVISCLEALLEDARSAKAIGVIVIAVDQNGSCLSSSAGAVSFTVGIAQLELFKAQLIRKCMLVNNQGVL